MVFMDMRWESQEQQTRWETEGCPARGCHLKFCWGLPGWQWQHPDEPGRLYFHWHGAGGDWPSELPHTEAVLEVPRCYIQDFCEDPAWRVDALKMILAWVDRVHEYEDRMAGKVPHLPGRAAHDARFVTDLDAGEAQDAAS